MTTEAIKTASTLGAMGLDPIRFITTTDPIERTMMVRIAEEMIKIKEIQDHNLAAKIAEQVGKLFRR